MRLAYHLYLKTVAHAGLLKILAEYAVDKTDGREVLHAVEALCLELTEVNVHNTEGVGTADARKNGGVLDNGKDFCTHLNDYLVCVAVGKQTGKRTAAGHAVAAGVVDYEHIRTARLAALSGDTGTGADADKDLTVFDFFFEFCNDLASGLSVHVRSP